MSRPKVHLVDAAEPLAEGAAQTALCGAIVPSAHFVFKWDSEALDYRQFPWNGFCRQCAEGDPRKRYLYGAISGQASLDPREAGETA